MAVEPAGPSLPMQCSVTALHERPRWPPGVRRVPFAPGLAGEIEMLLMAAYASGGSDPTRYAGWYRQVATDPEFDARLVLLARDEARGAIAGVCHLWTSAFVKDLAVRSEWRRRGVGSALLRLAMHTMADRGASHLRLKVEADNARAIRLYRAMGFTPTSPDQAIGRTP